MPTTETKNYEEYTLQADGTVIVDTQQIEVEVKTEAEIIADKEAKLLEMYEEIEALKAANSEG